MYFTYILKSEVNNKYYIGSCADVDKRLDDHNNGHVKSTKPHRPWKLIYSEQYNTFRDAYHREQQIKKWKSRSAIVRLIERS